MTEYIKKKQPVEYDDNVKEVFNLIAYHRDKPEVMGSANLKSQMYSADFDLFEKVLEADNLKKAKRDIYLTGVYTYPFIVESCRFFTSYLYVEPS